MERERAEQEARLQEEAQRRATAERVERAERRAAAAAAGAASGGAVGGEPTGEQPTDPGGVPHRRRQSSQAAAAEAQGRAAGASARARNSASQQEAQSRQAAAGQVPQYPTVPVSTSLPNAAQPGQSSAAAAAAAAGAGGASASRSRASFPHAFERWETLSAHWEGLTSFWIHKLQERSSELDRDPVNRTLSQQVQDLSAAGANLFHAVVELQRLRASSERKFQRWFFETRSELERNQEVAAMLEQSLAEERRHRAEAIRDAVDRARTSSKTEKQLLELRKELVISKEEARRAWEELGRREQEERERTASLQQGRPTIVGGVQVVPMSQGVPSRRGSEREPKAGSSQQGEYYEVAGDEQQQQHQGSYPVYSQAPAVQATTSAGPSGTAGGYYSQAEAAGSEGAYSEGEYAIAADGSFIRDSRGNRIPFRSPSPSHEATGGGRRGGRREQQQQGRAGGSDSGAEEYDEAGSAAGGARSSAAATTTTTSTGGGGAMPAVPAAPPNATSYPPGSSSQWSGNYPPVPQPEQGSGGGDYSGQGYAAPGWETLPRHHHPTRLSDVLEEEEERSRTSGPSQISRA